MAFHVVYGGTTYGGVVECELCDKDYGGAPAELRIRAGNAATRMFNSMMKREMIAASKRASAIAGKAASEEFMAVLREELREASCVVCKKGNCTCSWD